MPRLPDKAASYPARDQVNAATPRLLVGQCGRIDTLHVNCMSFDACPYNYVVARFTNGCCLLREKWPASEIQLLKEDFASHIQWMMGQRRKMDQFSMMAHNNGARPPCYALW